MNKKLVISGRVQGVNFRSFTKRTAIDLGLTGWVRNRRDGKVEVVANGNMQAIEKLIDAVKKGPSYSDVNDVEVSEAEPVDKDDFRIIK